MPLRIRIAGLAYAPAAKTTRRASTTMPSASRTPRTCLPTSSTLSTKESAKDREVGSSTSRQQVGQRHTHPDARTHVARNRPHSDRPWTVVVIDWRVTHSGGGCDERSLKRCQFLRRDTTDRDWSLRPVPWIGEVLVCLDRPHDRSQVVVAPSGVPGRCPTVVVGRPPSHPEGAVGCGAATHELGPRQRHLAAKPRAVGDEAPVVAHGRFGGICDVGRKIGHCRKVWPCLQKQDIAVRILAQPRGQDTSSGAGPHDNHVR